MSDHRRAPKSLVDVRAWSALCGCDIGTSTDDARSHLMTHKALPPLGHWMRHRLSERFMPTTTKLYLAWVHLTETIPARQRSVSFGW